MESHSHSSQEEQLETLNQVGRERLCRSQASSHRGRPEGQQYESKVTESRVTTSKIVSSVTPLSCVWSLEAQVLLASLVEHLLAISHCLEPDFSSLKNDDIEL